MNINYCVCLKDLDKICSSVLAVATKVATKWYELFSYSCCYELAAPMCFIDTCCLNLSSIQRIVCAKQGIVCVCAILTDKCRTVT